MPKYASSSSEAPQRSFWSFPKTVIPTNGFNLIRDVNFYDSDNVISTALTPEEIMYLSTEISSKF